MSIKHSQFPERSVSTAIDTGLKIQFLFHYQWGWIRLRALLGNVGHHTHSASKAEPFQLAGLPANLTVISMPVLFWQSPKFMPIDCHSVARHYQEESGLILLTPSVQYLYTLIRCPLQKNVWTTTSNQSRDVTHNCKRQQNQLAIMPWII